MIIFHYLKALFVDHYLFQKTHNINDRNTYVGFELRFKKASLPWVSIQNMNGFWLQRYIVDLKNPIFSSSW